MPSNEMEARFGFRTSKYVELRGFQQLTKKLIFFKTCTIGYPQIIPPISIIMIYSSSKFNLMSHYCLFQVGSINPSMAGWGGTPLHRKLLPCLLFLLDVLVSTSARRGTTVIPDDVRPGYTVKRMRPAPQHTAYTLTNSPLSDYFAVLEDGLVMTTSDLHPLVDLPINLGVLEETPNTTSSHTLHMYVLRRDEMLRFLKNAEPVKAHIDENLPVGSDVTMPFIRVDGTGTGGPIRFSIVGGNDHGAFTIHHNSSGAFLKSARILDREHRTSYKLNIQAADAKNVDRINTHLLVEVIDVNDNSPVFDQRTYRFSLGRANNSEWSRFTKMGRVHASDADDDKVAYRLDENSRIVVIVPQTGELLLTGDPPLGTEYELTVHAHDLRFPSRTSKYPAKVYLEFNLEEEDPIKNEVIRRDKRRVTRAVRPTKRIEFTEADGETEGRVVFQLEKETELETFKIRDENPWVTVEPNGAVRVKKKWDYEELGPEKTIDFWVTITNAGVRGESKFL